jgi:hypothetical protein
MIAKIQFKKRKNREKSEIGEYKRSKRKAIRDIEISDDSQRIEIAIGNCSDSVCKIRCELKEIFSLKRRVEKVDEDLIYFGWLNDIFWNMLQSLERHNVFTAGRYTGLRSFTVNIHEFLTARFPLRFPTCRTWLAGEDGLLSLDVLLMLILFSAPNALLSRYSPPRFSPFVSGAKNFLKWAISMEEPISSLP